MELYRHDRYHVFRGEDKGYALCSCWSSAQGLVERDKSIPSTFSLIGTLYSTEGVSILVRNLLLSPDIQYLFLWANHPLSRTEIGSKGWKELKKLWQGEAARLHEEIEPAAARQLVQDVRLVDVSDKPVEEVIREIRSGRYPLRDIKRRPKSFPETRPSIKDHFPSEGIGYNCRGEKVVEVWRKVVKDIMRYGHAKKTEYGSMQKELKLYNWIIHSEDIAEPYIPEMQCNEQAGLDYEAIRDYAGYFLEPEKGEGVSYTYGERLRSGFDQIQRVIDKLKGSSITRRAVATTLVPEKDLGSSSPPCMNHVQFMADDKLDMLAVFRSQDIFKAGIPNAFGLLHLHEHVSRETGIRRGTLSIVTNSAHIYEEDWRLAEQIMLPDDESFIPDPRGSIRIQVDGQIQLSLHSHDGKELLSFKKSTARKMLLCIKGLLSRDEHYCDIAIELVKAEVALKTGQPYVQDRPVCIKDSISIS